MGGNSRHFRRLRDSGSSLSLLRRSARIDRHSLQPLLVSQFSTNANSCLINGLRSSDPYFQVGRKRSLFGPQPPLITLRLQHFAYLELSTLTLTNPERRKAIFTEIRQDTSKGSWSEISRQCLKLIGTELQRAKGRGQLSGEFLGYFPESVS